MIGRLDIHAQNEDETMRFGRQLAACLGGRGAVHIKGRLGIGKTTLCRAVLRAMGHGGAVKSPTFTLVEPYETDDYTLYHFDLYRLSDPDELEYIGMDDYFRADCLCLIEWPEKAAGKLPQHDLTIVLRGSGNERTISLESNSYYGENVRLELANRIGRGQEL